MSDRYEFRSVSSTFQILLTAEQAFPALEAEFLAARSEIWASFRVFDPQTRLRSDAARKIGSTWFDLIVHTLARGVALNIVITDFDPVARPALHRATWRSLRWLYTAAEVAGPSSKLRATAAMHPSRTGLLVRIAIWPMIVARQARAAAWLNRRDPAVRETALREMPGLAARVVRRKDGRFRPRIWPLPCVYPATHHQKLAVFDRKRLYIGGLDLDERRFDTPRHDRPGEETWHDLQLLVDGPAVAEAQTHLETFLSVTANRQPPARQRRLLRTMSRRRDSELFRFGPHSVLQEIAVAHEHYARRTERLIYLETQYFRDLKLARYLARLGAANPDLGMILILPGAPAEIAYERRIGFETRFGEFLQDRAIRIVTKGFGSRLFIGGAAQPRREQRAGVNGTGRDRLHGAPLVYIHAKVSIFDDTSAIVSSANLNGRSLRWDTEAGLLITNRTHVQSLRRQVFSHWLPESAGADFFDNGKAVDAWRSLALRNAATSPEKRSGFIVPYDLEAAKAHATEVPFMPEEMV